MLHVKLYIKTTVYNHKQDFYIAFGCIIILVVLEAVILKSSSFDDSHFISVQKLAASGWGKSRMEMESGRGEIVARN